MKFTLKKLYIILLIFTLCQSEAIAKDNNKATYTRENISDYFSGIISAKNFDNKETHKYLKKVESLKYKHSPYNVKFLRNLVLLEKFEQAFIFSESITDKNKLFFEANLLLGLKSFQKKDFKNSEMYFERLNKISRYNLYFDDFVGNVLIAWSKALQGKKIESFNTIKKIPKPYRHLNEIQKTFLKWFFEEDDTLTSYLEIIKNKDFNFSRYNFFLVNYLLYKNKKKEAKNVIQNARKENISNILLEETEMLIKGGQYKKIKNFYNCKDPNDSLAEFFYVMANLYSSEENYRISNFYLKISSYLNDKFTPNKALLAENFYYQKKLKLSKNAYKEIKTIGPTYSWYASKSISSILIDERGKDYSIKILEKDFNSLSKPNFEHYYEMANFYKDNEYYEKSIKYYSLALKKITVDHFLIPKILYRRGTSYERSGDWKNAEKDLLKSLKIEPGQAHVMNYLAYSWIDQGVNLNKGLEMLIEANSIKEQDGYIIDSLGWAYFAKQDYVKAEEFLRNAVELLPEDPIINDHYADSLWMLEKTIQARYIWENVLKLEKTDKKLKDKISKKLLFGIQNQL